MSASYVGLDQSYSAFGISVLNEKGDHTFIQRFPAEKFGHGVDRNLTIYHYLKGFLEELDKTDPIRHVCMEGYARGRNNWREEAGELGALVKMALRTSLDAPVRYPTIIMPSQLKKFATGSGTAAKNTVLMHVFRKWGREFRFDGEADAYTLAKIAHGLENGVELAYEKDVLAAVKLHPEMPVLTKVLL